MVRIGVIGLGNMGSSHAKGVLNGDAPLAKLTAVADISAERREWAQKELGDVAIFDSAEKLMDSGLCDAVIIATPHYDHPPLARLAFSKRLHVLSEKPAGVYTKQVREMNEAADASGLVFALMFQQRAVCAFKKIREIIKSGIYGELRRTNWIMTSWYRTQLYYDSGSWRATWAGEGGGVLLNQCPHNLDLWQWTCGMPEKIHAYCHVGKWHDVEIEDDVSAYVEYPNGATGVFVTTTGDAPGTNRLEITLDRAKIICEDYTKLTIWELDKGADYYIKNSKSSFERPRYTKISYDFTLADEKDELLHMLVINAFASAILNGTELVADGREGINELTLSNAMYLSAWTGKAVTLPIDEEAFLAELNARRAKSKHKDVKSIITRDITESF